MRVSNGTLLLQGGAVVIQLSHLAANHYFVKPPHEYLRQKSCREEDRDIYFASVSSRESSAMIVVVSVCST